MILKEGILEGVRRGNGNLKTIQESQEDGRSVENGKLRGGRYKVQ
jgi:hypothetical protein